MGTASNPRRRDIPLPRSAVTLNDDVQPLLDVTQWSFYDFHHIVSRTVLQIKNAAEDVSDTATGAELDARDEIAQQATQMLHTLQKTPDLNVELRDALRRMGCDPDNPRAVEAVRRAFE